MQVARNVKDTKVQCEDMNETDCTASKNRVEVEVSEDASETTKDRALISFQDKLHKMLKELSERLTRLFISVMPTEEEALTSSKPAIKQGHTQHSDVGEQVAPDPTQVVGNFTRDQQQLIDALSMLPEGKQLVQSVWHVVNDIGTLDLYAVESAVSHMDLGYAGTVDLVAKYK